MVSRDATYPHLLPWVQEVAARSAGERIGALTVQHWIGYPLAQAALGWLESLLAHPEVLRTPYLLIAGPRNNGKSMIAERFRRQHPSGLSRDGTQRRIPVVVMKMPTKPSTNRFYAALLSALSAPLTSSSAIHIREQMALQSMRLAGTRLIVIDDLENISSAKPRQQREFLNLLRYLGNELRVPLVCLGTKEAYSAICSDEQLENRFAPFPLPRWKDDAELGRLLASFESLIPLREPSGLGAPALRTLILRQSEGTIGKMAELLIAAAGLALAEGREHIDADIIVAAEYRTPCRP
jgi:hypothetical protein